MPTCSPLPAQYRRAPERSGMLSASLPFLAQEDPYNEVHLYTASPPAIGSHAGYIPPPLRRLVLTLGIYRLPSGDWFSRW
eukprot:3453899-Pyramimonas_sp.AAC.1